MALISIGQVAFFKSDGSWWDFFIHIVSPKRTHVALGVGNDRIIEANGNGVQIRSFDPKWASEILSVKGISNQQIAIGVKYALSCNGEPYSYWTAVRAGVLRILGFKEKAYQIDQNWDCTEFVGVCLQKMGLNVCDGLPADQILPDDLYNWIIEHNRKLGEE